MEAPGIMQGTLLLLQSIVLQAYTVGTFIITILYRHGNSGSERAGSFPKLTELKIRSQEVLCQCPHTTILLHYCLRSPELCAPVEPWVDNEFLGVVQLPALLVGGKVALEHW
jgi:hypothetical protein